MANQEVLRKTAMFPSNPRITILDLRGTIVYRNIIYHLIAHRH